MDEKDPRLIVTLEAHGITAERAWNRPQNRDRCLPAAESVVDVSSRENTPAVDQPRSQIQLTFDGKPKNLEKGFVFGSDRRTCDVFLGERGAGFSRQQFCITFNKRGEVIFKNPSRKETQVDYNGEDPSRRTQFTWILFDTYDNIKITLGTDDLIFKVKWPKNRQYCLAEYEAHRNAYFEDCRTALPPISQLGMESQRSTAPTTARHSPRQESPGLEHPEQPTPPPIYLLEEKIGDGGSGTVYKAVDVSKGHVYAAKRFRDDTWKKEVEMLMKVSHEHIVKFKTFSEEQKPLLVMEYMPIGSIACQDSITEEETLQVLYQGLLALEYLHSHTPPLAHRDIKPANILIKSRMPFIIKLADFGYAKDDYPLRTFCGSDEYAAPEIWKRRPYTEMIDIWSLGVIVFEYIFELPEPTQGHRGTSWCRDIVKAAEDERNGDTLIELLLTMMLRMNPEERYSATECLAEVCRLGFDEDHTVDNGWTTPTMKTAGQDPLTRSQFIISQPLPSKRVLRDGDDFHSKLDDARGRGQSKRSRASVSFEAADDTLKPSKRKVHNPATHPRQMPQLDLGKIPLATGVASFTQAVEPIPRVSRVTRQVTRKSTQNGTRSPLGGGFAPAAEVGPGEVESPSSKRNIYGNVRAILAGNMDEGNMDDENEVEAKVTDFDETYVQLQIDSRIVLMRKKDCLLNATHILRLANTSKLDREHIIRIMRERTGIVPIPPGVGIPYLTLWVNFQHGRILCKHLKLEQKLKPLIEYGLEIQRDNGSNTEEQLHDYITERYPPFFTIDVLPQPVMVRKFDLRINANHICQAANQPKDELPRIMKEHRGRSDIVLDAEFQRNIYVDFWIAVNLCRRYGLAELEDRLRDLEGVPQEPVEELEPAEPVEAPNRPEFIKIMDFSSPVWVRKSDFRINAFHIAKLAGRSKEALAKFKLDLRYEEYDIMRGNKKGQGTYVDFDVGLRLCQEFGLPELEKRLRNLRRTSKGKGLDAELYHTEPQLPPPDIISARNESIQSKGKQPQRHSPERPRHQLHPLPGRSIINEPVKAKDAEELDSDSDAASSSDSDTSREPTPIRQWNAPPVPSSRRTKNMASSRPSLGRNDQYSLLDLTLSSSSSCTLCQNRKIRRLGSSASDLGIDRGETV